MAKISWRSIKNPRNWDFTDFEHAYYTAIADNGSDRSVMGKEKLRELATETVLKKEEMIAYEIARAQESFFHENFLQKPEKQC